MEVPVPVLSNSKKLQSLRGPSGGEGTLAYTVHIEHSFPAELDGIKTEIKAGMCTAMFC